MQIELLIRARCLRYLPMNQFSKQYFVLKSIRIIGVYSFVTYRQIRRPSNIHFSGTGRCPWLERGSISCGMFLIEFPRFLTPHRLLGGFLENAMAYTLWGRILPTKKQKHSREGSLTTLSTPPTERPRVP